MSTTLSAIASRVVAGWPDPSDDQLRRIAALLNAGAGHTLPPRRQPSQADPTANRALNRVERDERARARHQRKVGGRRVA